MLYTPVTRQCILRAAQTVNLPVPATLGLLSVERGTVGQVHKNADGSTDYGPMQVNSRWLSKLAHWHITGAELTYNGCLNIWVGTLILKYYVVKAGGRIWQGIGYYHSHTLTYYSPYEYSVYRHLRNMKSADVTRLIEEVNGRIPEGRKP